MIAADLLAAFRAMWESRFGRLEADPHEESPETPFVLCERCDDTGCPECDPEWALHQAPAECPR